MKRLLLIILPLLLIVGCSGLYFNHVSIEGTPFFVLEGDTLINLSLDDYVGFAPDMGAFESPFTVSINNEISIPRSFNLHQPYPNPFNPTTTIRFSVETQHATCLHVFDITGRLVETLVNGELQSGDYEIVWNASGLPSGVYFVRLESGEFVENQKVVLVK